MGAAATQNNAADTGPSPAARAKGRIRRLKADEIQNIVAAGKTPRTVELEGYQAYYEGTAYDARPHFYSDDVPLQQRKPVVIYPIVKLAAESNVAFAMGEGRFPTVLSLSSEGDDVFDKALGLSQTDSETLDSFNAKLIDLGRLAQVFRQAYRMAQASRSVAIVIGFRNGLPFADLVWSKLCAPRFDDPSDPQKCTALEIRYRYVEQFRDKATTGGEWWPIVKEYLRIIDADADTVYTPADIWDETDDGTQATKGNIRSQTKHGFGFCPVHWYARNRESLVGTSPDGKAIHDGMCGLVEQLDFALSQRHRAAIYAGDPQTVFIGASEEDMATLGQRGSKLAPGAATGIPDAMLGKGTQWESAFAMGSANANGKALKRGVLHPWVIKDPQGKALVLTLPGDALKALDDDAKDLASRACDGLGVTVMDPSSFSGSGDLSGRTLSFLFSKQINRVSLDRDDLGACCILPVLSLFYRALLSQPKGVYLPGLNKVLPILGRFYQTVAGTSQKVWFAPQLKLKWGDYFEPSDVDEATRVQTAIAALTASPALITQKTAVEHIRGVFPISNVDQYVDALQAEAADRQQQAVANAQAMAAAAPPKPGNPAAQQSPSAAPPASGSPKPKRGNAQKKGDK